MPIQYGRILAALFFIWIVALHSGCTNDRLAPVGAMPPTTVPTATATWTLTPTITPTGTPTMTPTVTPTPTDTLTPVCTMQPTSTPIIETTDFGDDCSYSSAFNMGTITSSDAVVEGTLHPTSDYDRFYFVAGLGGTWTFVLDCMTRSGDTYSLFTTNPPDVPPGCQMTGIDGSGPTLVMTRTLTSGVTCFWGITRTPSSAPVSYRVTILAP